MEVRPPPEVVPDCAMRSSPADEIKGGGESDSDSTHDSMPALTPLVLPKSPPQQQTETKSIEFGAFLQRARAVNERASFGARGRGLARASLGGSVGNPSIGKNENCWIDEPGTNKSALGVKSLAHSASEAEAVGATSTSSLVAPVACEKGDIGSAAYDQRAAKLAAVLDVLGTTKSASSVDEGGKVSSADGCSTSAGKESCDALMGSGIISVPTCADEIIAEEDVVSITPAAKRKLAASQAADEEFLAAGDENSDDSEDDDEDEDEGACAPKRPRRSNACGSVRILDSLPPGAPAAAPASTEVEAATSAAASASGAAGHIATVSSSSASSFGPRFRGLTGPELAKAQSSWTLHSLADVPRTSASDNRSVAAAFLEDLRRRQNATAPAAAKDLTVEMSTDSGPTSPFQKPTFKRPRPRDDTNSNGQNLGAASRGGVVSGTRLMDECVAGSRQRRPSAASAVPESEEQLHTSKRGRGRGGRGTRGICAAATLLEEGDG